MNERSMKRRMMRQELKDTVKKMGISMSTAKRFFKISGAKGLAGKLKMLMGGTK